MFEAADAEGPNMGWALLSCSTILPWDRAICWAWSPLFSQSLLDPQ